MQGLALLSASEIHEIPWYPSNKFFKKIFLKKTGVVLVLVNRWPLIEPPGRPGTGAPMGFFL